MTPEDLRREMEAQLGRPVENDELMQEWMRRNPQNTENGVWSENPAVRANAGLDESSADMARTAGAAPAQTAAMDSANTGARYWEDFFGRGPADVTMPTFDAANSEQARAWQQALIQDLQQQAAGDPNSRAQQSLRGNFAEAGQQQTALGSAARGTGGAAGLRAGARGEGDVHRGLAGEQQLLMAQEQQAAQAALAQMLAQQRGMDAQQAAAQADATLQGRSMQQAMDQFYAQQYAGSALAREQTALERQAAMYGLDLETQKINQQIAQSAAGAGAGALGAASQSGLFDSDATDSIYGPGYAQDEIDDAFNG